jgi:hypothetical protein
LSPETIRSAPAAKCRGDDLIVVRVLRHYAQRGGGRYDDLGRFHVVGQRLKHARADQREPLGGEWAL